MAAMTVPQPPAPLPPNEPINPFAQTPPPPPRRPSRLPVIVLTVLLAITLVALGVVTAQLAGLAPTSPLLVGGPTAKAISQPVAVTADAVTIGSATAPATVDLYVDYMCPFCGTFDRMNGPAIAAGVEDGTVLLRLHPMSFLDNASGGTQYSTRAANAVVTVAKLAPGNVLAFHMELFVMQPMENTPGLTDDNLAEIAASVGVPADVVAKLSAGENKAWVATATEADFAAGITGTPTVMVNGTKLGGSLYQPGALTEALANAKR